MSRFALRLRQQSTSFVRGKMIETMSLSIDQKLSDATTLSATVSALVHSGLTFPLVASVVWTDGTTWSEMPGGSFIFNEVDLDAVDPSQARSLTGVQVVPWLLQNTVLLVPAGVTQTDTQITYKLTPGGLVGGLAQASQARGWAPHLVLDFTATKDSNGVAWTAGVTTQTINIGDSLWSVLTTLVNAKLCEFSVDGQTLHLYNPGTGVNRTQGAARVQLFDDATTAPVKTAWTNIATKVIGQMDGQKGTTSVNVPNAYTAFGTLETFVSLSGIKDTTSALTVLNPAATQAAAPMRQVSITENAVTARFLPWRDYNVGDSLAYRAESGWEYARLTELAVNYDGTGVTIQTSFGSTFLSVTEQLAGIVTGQLGGQTLGGTGKQITPPPEVIPAPAEPNAPSDVSVTTTAYFDQNGAPDGRIDATWTAIGDDINGNDLVITTYEVWLQDAAAGSTTYMQQSATTLPSFTLSDLPMGGHYLLSVVAVSQFGGRSAQSSPIDVTIPAPAPTLAAPDAPVLTSALSTVTAAWDGLFGADPDNSVAGAAGDPSFWQVQTFVTDNLDPAGDGSQPATWAPVGAPLLAAGSVNIPGYAMGDTVFVTFTAYDHAGNATPSSDVAQIDVQGVTGDDLDANSITANSGFLGALTTALVQSPLGSELDLSSNESITLIAGQQAQQQEFFRFTSEGAVVSSPSSPYEVVVTNDSLEIRYNGTPVSTWTADAMTVSTFVGGTVTLGNHQITKGPTGHTIVRAL